MASVNNLFIIINFKGKIIVLCVGDQREQQFYNYHKVSSR